MPGFDVQRVIAAYQAGKQIRDSKDRKVQEAEDRKLAIEQKTLELKHLKLQEKQMARQEAMQTAQLQQGQPAEEFGGLSLPATSGGPSEDAGAQPQPQGQPANTMQALLQQARQRPVPLQSAGIPGVQVPPKELPLPAVNIPGVFGPDTTVQPQSRQELQRQSMAQKLQEMRLQGMAPFNVPEGGMRVNPLEGSVIENPRAPTEKAATLTPQPVNLDGKPALVLRDSQGNYFDIETKQPVVGRITPYVAPPTPRQKGDITPNAESNLITNLNTQWQKASKDVQDLYRANTIMDAGMAAARKGDMNAGSQAVLVTFQKFLDPTSVVRESEYARSAEGLAIAERARGFVEKLLQGGAGVTLQELETFAALGREINERLAKEGDSLLSSERARISAIAGRYEIPVELVIPRYDYSKPAGSKGNLNFDGFTFPDQKALDEYKRRTKQ